MLPLSKALTLMMAWAPGASVKFVVLGGPLSRKKVIVPEAVSVVLGFLGGHWLDEHLNTAVIFTLIGVLLGLVGSATNTVRLYRSLLRRSESERQAQTTESAPAPADDAKPHG